jgi:hypothetical protein
MSEIREIKANQNFDSKKSCGVYLEAFRPFSKGLS